MCVKHVWCLFVEKSFCSSTDWIPKYKEQIKRDLQKMSKKRKRGVGKCQRKYCLCNTKECPKVKNKVQCAPRKYKYENKIFFCFDHFLFQFWNLVGKCWPDCENSQIPKLKDMPNTLLAQLKIVSMGPNSLAIVADQLIPENKFLGFYEGSIKYSSDVPVTNEYVFILDKRYHLVVDGNDHGTSTDRNFATLINHACKHENTAVYLMFVEEKPVLALFSLRPIARGEQITINYLEKSSDGEDWEFIKKKKCNCLQCRHEKNKNQTIEKLAQDDIVKMVELLNNPKALTEEIKKVQKILETRRRKPIIKRSQKIVAEEKENKKNSILVTNWWNRWCKIM